MLNSLKQKEMVNFQFLQQKTIKFEVIIFITQKLKNFFVVSGKARFHMKDVSTNKKIEYLLDHKKPTVIETIPGWQHYIKNIGKKN